MEKLVMYANENEKYKYYFYRVRFVWTGFIGCIILSFQYYTKYEASLFYTCSSCYRSVY